MGREELAAAGAEPGLLEWLLERGSLTARLRARLDPGMRVQLLHQGPHPGVAGTPDAADPAAAGQQREIFIRCFDRPVIYARTEIPAETLAAQPWLRGLGERSLGDALVARDDVTRSPFGYARLPLASALPRAVRRGLVTPAPEATTWVRRYTFSIAGARLTVAEHFLPAFLALVRTRAAGQPLCGPAG